MSDSPAAENPRPADPALPGAGRPRLALPAAGPGSLAPTGRRIAAIVVDSLASAFIAGLFVHRKGLPGLAAHLPGTWSLIPFAIDYVVGMMLAGQTLGMRLLNLRVVRTDRPSARIDAGRAIIRTVLLMIFIPAIILDKDHRGLHERVTDTVVVQG